jgi:alpha-tubulin suppressor-like RCC1 family protein
MVLGGLTFKALAVGRTHTCGITTNNHVWCWGDNYVGEIGAPTPGQTTGIPVKAM